MFSLRCPPGVVVEGVCGALDDGKAGAKLVDGAGDGNDAVHGPATEGHGEGHDADAVDPRRALREEVQGVVGVGRVHPHGESLGHPLCVFHKDL